MGRRRRRRRAAQVVETQRAGTATAAPRIPRLVPWRERMQAALDCLETWVHDRHGATVEAFLVEALRGRSVPEADRERIVDDFVCTPGSAPDGRSLLRACAAECDALDDEARDQFLRWERERRRGVFIVQRAHADALETWDPLEGAPLTLHLLMPPGERERACAVPGTVLTATYRPWMARLVIVQAPEYFAGDEAIPVYRREVMQRGTAWHEPPAAAPVRTRRR